MQTNVYNFHMPFQIKAEFLLHPGILLPLPGLPLAMFCHDLSHAQVYSMFQKRLGNKNYLLKGTLCRKNRQQERKQICLMSCLSQINIFSNRLEKYQQHLHASLFIFRRLQHSVVFLVLSSFSRGRCTDTIY